MQVNEVNILKVAIANLVDETIGSTRGWTVDRELKMIMERFGFSKVVATAVLEACDEVREANAYDLI
jgi:hypothetical protein